MNCNTMNFTPFVKDLTTTPRNVAPFPLNLRRVVVCRRNRSLCMDVDRLWMGIKADPDGCDARPWPGEYRWDARCA